MVLAQAYDISIFQVCVDNFFQLPEQRCGPSIHRRNNLRPRHQRNASRRIEQEESTRPSTPYRISELMYQHARTQTQQAKKMTTHRTQTRPFVFPPSLS